MTVTGAQLVAELERQHKEAADIKAVLREAGAKPEAIDAAAINEDTTWRIAFEAESALRRLTGEQG